MKTDHHSNHKDGKTTASAVYKEMVLDPLFASAKSHSRYYDLIDKAYAVMLSECRILDHKQGVELLAALDQIHNRKDISGRMDAGPYEDLFYVREAALRDLLGPDLAGRLHTGRSRNDLEATVFRLQLKGRIHGALSRLLKLSGVLLDVAQREAETPILAYTHGQPAQPGTYGHYLGALSEVLLRDAQRLSAALAEADACPLGAAAIMTTGFPIDRERLAQLLGFERVQENSYGCIAAVDQFAQAQTALNILFINIGRWVQDMAFWTSFEVGQARAGDGFVQISSIMPQKRNPLAIEHLRVMASLGAGHCQTALMALHNTPFADMVDAEGPTQSAGLASFDMAHRVLGLMEAFVRDLQIDVPRVLENTNRSCAAMTELADSLVRLEGIPFRIAHEIAADLARMLVDAGRGLDQLEGQEVAQAFERHVGRPSRADAQALRQFVRPKYFVQVRDRTGGPAPGALHASLQRYRALADALASGIERVEAREREAHASLQATVAQRMGA